MMLIRLLVMAASLLLAPAVSMAQKDSGRTIRIIVPYAAGGLVDVMNRIIANRMAQTLGQPVIIENRPGANANIAPAFVMQAAPDGQTLLASASYFSTNPLIEKNLQWDPKKLMPVARFATAPSVLVAPGSGSIGTLKDLIAAAKANPGLPVAEAGAGAVQTMVTEILQDSAKIRFTSVQYKGGVSYIPDLINGTLVMGVIPLNVVLSLVRNGKLKGLAITSSKRSPLLPEVPSLAEIGFPEAALVSWLGFHVSTGTPQETIKRLVVAVEEAAANEEVKGRLAELGAESDYLDTAAFDAFLRADLVRSQRFVRLMETKAKPQ